METNSTTTRVAETTITRNWQGIVFSKFKMLAALAGLVLGSNVALAQGVGISESSITPDPSSILEIRST